MVRTSDLKAARKFGPGYFIREQTELRDWTQDDLASVMGITVKHLNKILQDQQPLTLDIARILAEVFDTSVQYWINLDTDYRLWLVQAETNEVSEVDIKSTIYERMPVKDMVAKGWLHAWKSAAELKQQVLAFWGWETLDFSILDQEYFPCLTRKSAAYNQFKASYAITWYRKAMIEAARLERQPYDRQKLEQLFDSIHEYTVSENGINQFIEALTHTGVIFFVLPHLQKTYLDGAAFFSGKNPVIVYTGRHKRIDHFWFTIAHEIAHVLHHLNDETPFVLDNLKDDAVNQIETEANAEAAAKLRHPEIFRFLEPYLGYLPTSKVEECAAVYQVHPSIIIGKLAHEKRISYANMSLYNDNVLLCIHEQYQIGKK
jgi:HTH-type transcriptional regulator/antitoxin HigA